MRFNQLPELSEKIWGGGLSRLLEKELDTPAFSHGSSINRFLRHEVLLNTGLLVCGSLQLD